MDLSFESEQTEYTVWLDVTGDDVPAYEPAGGPAFYPTRAIITYTNHHDGEPSTRPSVKLFGVVMLSGGRRGRAQRQDTWVREADRPEWVSHAIIHHAPSWWR